MEINKEVETILKEFKINKSQGILILLGIYYDLDVETVCSEEAIKAINLTKIVEKDYTTNTIKWNMPLFAGQETGFEWVGSWIDGFGDLNIDRKGSARDAITRMKAFFIKYPEYRKDDVIGATELYFKYVVGTMGVQYLMKSHKFIFDGVGAMKKSTLLEYCEKVKAQAMIGTSTNGLIGRTAKDA